MIYQKLIVTDQSYEVSCQDIYFVPCPMKFSYPHAVVCDAFISKANKKFPIVPQRPNILSSYLYTFPRLVNK